MTQGALIFAFDNEEIDYVKLAAWNARNIHEHLKIPVAIVTDSVDVPDVFDVVIPVPDVNVSNLFASNPYNASS